MVTVRELEEKTNIKESIIKYCSLDKKFNYNIYLYQLEEGDVMERMESEKNSEQRFYILKEYRVLIKQKEYTDSHNKYAGNIINIIKEEEMAQIFNIGRDWTIHKRKQQDKQEGYSLIKIVIINTQRNIDIIVRKV